ncbi:MAG TPA: nicotinate-nicotinamide nucleotide adenylyltransferase [Candidatus Dormibacteraeota bacterium]|nr:nicotinate-nicotinamide nucleotide adenylyltransferase [Candidatus Dormibacteraeota bacterium]
MARIGIYAGTFDPVHAGHITFALQSLRAAQLDKLYFLPERRPRNKHHVEHFGHRVAMLKRATAPYPQFDVLELVDVSFSVERTLPELRQRFKDAELAFLFGSDILPRLRDWPKVDRLLMSSELVIGLREDDDRQRLRRLIEAWPSPPKALTMFDSYAPKVSSGRVRDALRRRQSAPGLLTSVERYSDHHWLYVSLS